VLAEAGVRDKARNANLAEGLEVAAE